MCITPVSPPHRMGVVPRCGATGEWDGPLACPSKTPGECRHLSGGGFVIRWRALQRCQRDCRRPGGVPQVRAALVPSLRAVAGPAVCPCRCPPSELGRAAPFWVGCSPGACSRMVMCGWLVPLRILGLHGFPNGQVEHVKPLCMQVAAVLVGELALERLPVGLQFFPPQLVPDKYKLHSMGLGLRLLQASFPPLWGEEAQALSFAPSFERFGCSVCCQACDQPRVAHEEAVVTVAVFVRQKHQGC